MGIATFASGVSPAAVPSIHTLAHGTALMLRRPFGTDRLSDVIWPGFTSTEARVRKPSVSLTRSSACDPSVSAIGDDVEPTALPFSNTCTSIVEITLSPPKRLPAVPAGSASAGFAGCEALSAVGADSGTGAGAGGAATGGAAAG